MTEQIIISFDLKKYRVRLYKAFLHELGDPLFIQLLVNPEKKLVAVRALDYELSGDQSHKINKTMMDSKKPVEIYSRSFAESLLSVINDPEPARYYKIYGTIIKKERMGVFSLNRIEKQSPSEDI
ncbi:MAG: hypothetical protein IK085_04855 [Clostridia bacterium]|nr:hypothetical protein [Clostridia bacterium]